MSPAPWTVRWNGSRRCSRPPESLGGGQFPQSDELAEVVEVTRLRDLQERREYAVDLVLHGALEFVPDEAPTELGLDVADQFRAYFDAPQGAQLGAEILGGALVGDRSTEPDRCGSAPLDGYPVNPLPGTPQSGDGQDRESGELEQYRREPAVHRGHRSPKGNRAREWQSSSAHTPGDTILTTRRFKYSPAGRVHWRAKIDDSGATGCDRPPQNCVTTLTGSLHHAY